MSIIEKRISIRKFNHKEIAKEDILKIVEAGMIAPSSRNNKPWQFIILDDKKLIEKVANFHKNWITLKEANKVIIVCGDLECDDRVLQVLMACSASTENILLKATELEIGSVWLGAYPDEMRLEALKEEFNIPSNIVPISVVALGYCDNRNIRERKINSEKIHLNKW
ncbi:FMN reductase [NAD(P)H] [uncultured Clostridium sp.]|uniref:nitroreductase family protein n=1 Tax=uncultured Clostridium sp. TaxID=59620 RepID=UPI0008231E3D|nr:nitroreductase family protein [uncultured Clostridium sp.]SCJ93373.1 FMN reductase [NAD(P)H] [uncultured Clostridium sp.]